MGDKFIEITGNRALEGFTLPKLLWVKENEPEIPFLFNGKKYMIM